MSKKDKSSKAYDFRKPYTEHYAFICDERKQIPTAESKPGQMTAPYEFNYDYVMIEEGAQTFTFGGDEYTVRPESFYRLKGWDPLSGMFKSYVTKFGRAFEPRRTGVTFYRKAQPEPITFRLKLEEKTYKDEQSPMMVKALVQQDLYNKGIKSIISKTKMSRKTILVLALAVIAIIVVFIVLKGGI
jgi:hypothetical protein